MNHSERFISLLIVFAATHVHADDPDESDWKNQLAVPFLLWQRNLHKIGARYRFERMKLKDADTFERLVDEVTKASADLVVKIEGRVHQVHWKDGQGTVSTTVPFLTNKPTSSRPLRISAMTSFRVKVSREDAIETGKGMPISFRGKLTFYPRLRGDANFTAAAQKIMFISHKDYTGTIGTFASDKYEVHIGRKEFEGYWADKK